MTFGMIHKAVVAAVVVAAAAALQLIKYHS